MKRWTKQSILDAIRRHAARKYSLAYTQMVRREGRLVSAAAYHFGSYRAAVIQAGVDYDQHLRRPRWTVKRIIQLIKQARRAEEPLHWSAVCVRRDPLGRAATVARRKRLFGSWARALQAAGVDSDEVALHRRWDRHSVIYELKSRAADHLPMSSAQVQQDDPALHAAAVRLFQSYANALRQAGINPARCRLRQKWDENRILGQIRKRARAGKSLSDSEVRLDDPALHAAAGRWFGSFVAARSAAGCAGSGGR